MSLLRFIRTLITALTTATAAAMATAIAIATPALADDPALAAIRSEFQRAYFATDSTTDTSALRNYSLYPYIQQMRMRRALASPAADFAAIDREVEEFLKTHDKEAVSAELRRAWYPSLAKRQQWERLLTNYRDINDAAIQCYGLAARVALQRFESLQSAAVFAWSSAAESRPACEPVFTWLKLQDALTPTLIETRARLALSTGNAAFARQLIAMLPIDTPKETTEPLATWAALIERPRNAIDAAISAPKKAIEPAALLDGWIRLVRSDTNGAIQRYGALVKVRSLPPEAASRYALEIALVLAWNRRPEALTYFAKVRASELDDRGAEWYVRAALWADDWKRAAQAIDMMSPALRQQTKWRYWAARATEHRGKQDFARTQYAALLNDDNYYAALAAARLKKPYLPHPKAMVVDEEKLQALATQPAFLRAHELLQLESFELRNIAYDEWRNGLAKLETNARLLTAALAARWRWYDQTILTAAQQSMFDDYELLYPHPFDTAVQTAADNVKLPAPLIYAILRQESLYRIDAQSVAGAKGLMQLIPESARRIARHWPNLLKTVRDPKELTDPTTNIYLGAAMLHDFVDRFDGKTAIALAAYNAGPVNAERWFPKRKTDIDVWVENIPFNETRIYVQRVLWHSVVFGWIATREPQSTSSWLTDVVPDKN